MTDDQSDVESGDEKKLSEFVENELTEYIEEGRLERGILRLEVDDGPTRRLVVDDDTVSIDRFEYILRELEEVIALIDENEELLDEPLEVSIPVADTERVIEEAKENEAVTTVFQTAGITTILEHVLKTLGGKRELAEEDSSTE